MGITTQVGRDHIIGSRDRDAQQRHISAHTTPKLNYPRETEGRRRETLYQRQEARQANQERRKRRSRTHKQDKTQAVRASIGPGSVGGERLSYEGNCCC